MQTRESCVLTQHFRAPSSPESVTRIATDMEAFLQRALALGLHVVSLPSTEYAHAKAETLRTGKFTADYDDADGICTFFLRDGDLFLRTAQGEVKAVAEGAVTKLVHASGALQFKIMSSFASFIQYCHSTGVSDEQALSFTNALKFNALLDHFLVYKPPSEVHGAFVLVTKTPTDDTPLPLALLGRCALSHTVYLAVVHREDVDILALVAKLRRSSAAETLRKLEKRADVSITCIMTQSSADVDESAHRILAEDPRTRFLRYATMYRLPRAMASSFADAFTGSTERLLDLAVLSTDNRNCITIRVCANVPLPLTDTARFLVQTLVLRLPESVKSATKIALFNSTPEAVEALAARLRNVDPARTLDFIQAAEGFVGRIQYPDATPVSPEEAAHACASCGRRGSIGGSGDNKLRLCGACGLVRYCDATCQRTHWKLHKAECRRATQASQ